MESVYFVIGVFLLFLGITDIIWTTLWTDGGAGPVSRRTTMFFWKVFRKVSGDKDRLLSVYGPFILTLTLGIWVLLIWAGWTFMFGGDSNSLVDTRTSNPISWSDRIYFVAYTMFTMGNGDFYPKEGFWQMVASLTTASGMLFVTLGASYLISVLGGVVQKRAFAESVLGIGKRSLDIVQEAWEDNDFDQLNLLLMSLSTQMSTLVQQHKAYPLLHYYHSEKQQQAVAVAVAVLDEALTLIRYGVPEEVRPNQILQKEMRSSIQSYLETLDNAFIKPVNQSPPIPALAPLQELGIPTVSDEEFRKSLADLDARRRKLLGAVQADGWDWPL